MNLDASGKLLTRGMPSLFSVRIVVALLVLCMAVSIAIANQTSSGSAQDGAQAGPITMNYPSPLTMQVGRTGTAVTIADASAPLNSVGGVTSAPLSPSIAATTNATVMNVSALGCVLSVGRCANRGTMTLTFSRAVTNPVLHISGLGGNQGTDQYHTSMILTSWVASGTPTLTLTNGNGNLQVTGNEIGVASINGGTACGTSPIAGCGSVRINGTVTSVTFQIDLRTAGTGTPTAANVDAFTITASVDEDYGDAPSIFESFGGAASHVVGGLFMGAGVTADNVAVTNGGTQPSPFPSANASTDTDNGVTAGPLIRGQTTIVNVAVTGSGGLLQAWVDWADDGSFLTGGDRIAINAVDGGTGDSDGSVNGVIALSVPVPANAALTETIARFRLSSTTSLSYTGLAPDGEVEDYAVTAQASYADLSLVKIVSNATPAVGEQINFTLQVTNAAAPSVTATSVAVTDILPAGVTFVSAVGNGTYNSATGIWSVGTLAPGANAGLIITVNVTAPGGTTVTNSAEISASSIIDVDSTVNNGSTTEDDDAQASFTVAAPVAGTPPTLTCASGSNIFSWAGKTWTAGSLNNSYTATNVGNINFALSTDNPFVAGSPALNNTLTGGISGAISLFENLNNTSRTQNATTVISLQTAVPALQFRLFDVDFTAASFVDKVTVTGTFGGNNVPVTLTNGVANFVVGNSAIGSASADNTSANGNVVVTFQAPVDTITIIYGNDTSAPADPANQFMGIHDITYCNPVANLSVTKVSNIRLDGVSATNPKAIPGATVQYCLLVSNAGSATATAVSVGDPLPATVTYVPGTLRSGTDCATANTVEDDNATGTDESDPFGVSVTGTTLTGTAASLAPSAAFAVRFNATIN